MMMMMESSYTIFWRDWESNWGAVRESSAGFSSAVKIHVLIFVI